MSLRLIRRHYADDVCSLCHGGFAFGIWDAGPPAFFRAALDALVEPAQIQTPDQRPDQSCRMIVANQSLHIHSTPTHLLSVHPSDQRLAARIFLAHAASLLLFVQFSRTNSDGFLHSFYSYDAASNRTGFTDPENGSTTYVYDTLNRLQTLTPPSSFSGTGSFGFSYDALSRRTQMTRPNNVATNYTYDNLSHLQSILHQLSGSTIDGASYGLDSAGNRTSKTDQRAGVTSNYAYDAIYELTGVTQSSTTTESYTYDPVGNRLSSLGVSPYNVNVSNELASTPSTTYTYDNNGNTLTKIDSTGTTSYTWDFENRLTSVTLPGTGGTVSFKYDPFGRRIYKSSSSGTSIYAYDKDNLIEETNGAGAVVARYSQTQTIDEPLAMLRSGTTSYYNADGLGSVTSLSGSAGSLTQTYAYDSFGKQTSSSGSLTNPFQYTGRESDPETGIYYYRARYYDQNTGRFASEDPIRFKGGINFYAYVSNNPATITDPSGLLPSGVGPEACVYYDELCKRSCPPDAYACKAGQCCREFGNGPKQNCVRKCLIDQDKICTQNSPNSLQSCRLVNHVLCYSVCGFRPTGVPISCLKIALGF